LLRLNLVLRIEFVRVCLHTAGQIRLARLERALFDQV
jgi:hypothetical protein